MGAATMVVYLLHGFAVKGAEFAGFADWAAGHPYLAVPPLVGSAIGLTILLACRPMASRLERVVDPLGHAEQRARQAVLVAAVAAEPVPEAVRAVVEATDPERAGRR